MVGRSGPGRAAVTARRRRRAASAGPYAKLAARARGMAGEGGAGGGWEAAGGGDGVADAVGQRVAQMTRAGEVWGLGDVGGRGVVTLPGSVGRVPPRAAAAPARSAVAEICRRGRAGPGRE